MRSLFLLFLIWSSASCLNCFDSRRVEPLAAIERKNLTKSTVKENEYGCGLRLEYDDVVRDIVSVDMYSIKGNYSAGPKCNRKRRRMPRSMNEVVDMYASVQGATIITCTCSENLCNRPELAMDFLESKNKIVRVLKREIDRIKTTEKQYLETKMPVTISITTSVSLLLILISFGTALFLRFRQKKRKVFFSADATKTTIPSEERAE